VTALHETTATAVTLDAAPLLEWLTELGARFHDSSAEAKAVRDIRAIGRVSLHRVDRICLALGRPEMPGILYPPVESESEPDELRDACAKRYPHRGFRHSMATVRRARELHEAGWSYARIANLLSSELGVRVAPTTVLRWCDALQHARAVANQSRRNRSVNTAKKSGRIGSKAHTPEFREHRARQLLAAGMSVMAVTQVMRFDYPNDRWTRLRVLALDTDRQLAETGP
jgi:hypothetical protein